MRRKEAVVVDLKDDPARTRIYAQNKVRQQSMIILEIIFSIPRTEVRNNRRIV